MNSNLVLRLVKQTFACDGESEETPHPVRKL
jgi:hypothetical protein